MRGLSFFDEVRASTGPAMQRQRRRRHMHEARPASKMSCVNSEAILPCPRRNSPENATLSEGCSPQTVDKDAHNKGHHTMRLTFTIAPVATMALLLTACGSDDNSMPNDSMGGSTTGMSQQTQPGTSSSPSSSGMSNSMSPPASAYPAAPGSGDTLDAPPPNTTPPSTTPPS